MRLIINISLLLISFQGLSQISVTRAVLGSLGQDASVGSGMTYMYNVGETAVETMSSASWVITAGFEQPPYERDSTITPPPLVDTSGITVINNAFSPDGDGVNDRWEILQITNYPENHVSIFNRWGDMIWEEDNYDNVNTVWDGTNQIGEPVTGGTYFYVITINNSIRSYSGWVQVTK